MYLKNGCFCMVPNFVLSDVCISCIYNRPFCGSMSLILFQIKRILFFRPIHKCHSLIFCKRWFTVLLNVSVALCLNGGFALMIICSSVFIKQGIYHLIEKNVSIYQVITWQVTSHSNNTFKQASI